MTGDEIVVMVIGIIVINGIILMAVTATIVKLMDRLLKKKHEQILRLQEALFKKVEE